MLAAYGFVTLIVLVTVLADYYLKLAADRPESFSVWPFWAGAVLYAASAFGWVLAMKHLSLAAIGVYYSMLTILLLTALGVVVFRETLGPREWAGIACALAAIVLMARIA